MTDTEDEETWLKSLPLETPSDFEKAAQAIEQRLRPAARAKRLAAMIRGMGHLGSSPLVTEGTIGRFFFETPPPGMETFKSPEFQASYCERLRDWALYGDSADVMQIIEATLGIRPTTRELQAFTSKESRERLAAGLEAMAQSGGLPLPPRRPRHDSIGFSSEEFARLRRALHHFGPQLVESVEGAESGDPSRLVESAPEVTFGLPAILLTSPSPKQRFGRGKRSPLLLPEDRRRCQFRGCNLSVANRRRYCLKHGKLIESERDRIKKRRARDRARVRRSAGLADRPVHGA